VFLLQEGIDEMAASVEQAVGRAGSAKEAPEAMVDAHIDFYAAYQSFARVVLMETWRLDPANTLSAQRLLSHDLKVVSRVISGVKEAGLLNPDLGEAFLVAAFYGLLSATAVYFSVVEDHLDSEMLKRNLKELLFRGALRQHEQEGSSSAATVRASGRGGAPSQRNGRRG
jgi:hypothetical protein